MDLAQILPPGGLGAVGTGGLLALVILYLLNANRTDRKEYQEAIDKAEGRADAAEKRRAAEAEAAEARRAAETARMDALQQALDEARAARRSAEDRAAVLDRELAQYRGGDPP